MPVPVEFPPKPEDDFLERLTGHVQAVKDFRDLVVDLSVGDLTGEPYWGADFDEAEVNDDGRLSERFQFYHGHYDITPVSEPTIDEIRRIDASVILSRKEGGFRYDLNVESFLNQILTVTFFDDFVPSSTDRNEDLLKRIQLTREAARGIGIAAAEVTDIANLVSGIKAVQLAGRLTLLEECNCL